MTGRPEVRIFPDLISFYSGAADLVRATLASSLQNKQAATLILSGGNTPKRLFELLAAEPETGKVDWPRVHFLWSDERPVGPEDPQSNFRMARNTLLSKIDVRPGHVHRIKGEMKDSPLAAAAYEEEIRSLFKGDEICPDLVLLGMGSEGHTASLFPGTAWDEERLVVAIYVPKLESYRISMTPRILNSARAVVFLVAGADKAQAVCEVLEHSGSVLPAARIRPTAGRVVWLLDRQAASLIKK